MERISTFRGLILKRIMTKITLNHIYIYIYIYIYACVLACMCTCVCVCVVNNLEK